MCLTVCYRLQFDRERIPERVVHARGASAKGFFEVSLWPLLSHPALLSYMHMVSSRTALPTAISGQHANQSSEGKSGYQYFSNL